MKEKIKKIAKPFLAVIISGFIVSVLYISLADRDTKNDLKKIKLPEISGYNYPDLESKINILIDELENRINDLESRIDDVEYRMDDIENKMDDIENNINDLEFQIRKLKWSIDDLESRMSDLEWRIRY